MNPALQEALTPILDDLRRTNGFQFTIKDDEEHTVWLLDAEGHGIGVTIDADFDAASNAARIGESVQEYALEIGRRPWPECPTHPNAHPLWLSDGAYICPVSGTVHGHLGLLGA